MVWERKKKRKRLSAYRARGAARSSENLADGQDSFLDVVSNLVGVLIILIMIAGVRVRNATSDQTALANETTSTLSEEEREERDAYVFAATKLADLRARVKDLQSREQETSDQAALLRAQADSAEAAYRQYVEESTQMTTLLERESAKKSEKEREEYALQCAILDREKTLDALRQEKAALANARPNAITIENVPTPISQRVEDGREGYFRLKGGRLSHVPIRAFEERVMLGFKGYRGDMTPRLIDTRIGPIDGYYFQYQVELTASRESDGVHYAFSMRYGECQPTTEPLGEPVDEALARRDSVFLNRLMKYSRQDTTITIFAYADSFAYLNDIKKYLFSLGYQTAIRPMLDSAPIAISPQGTKSSTY